MNNDKTQEAMNFFAELVTDGGNINTKEKLIYMRLCWNRVIDMQTKVVELERKNIELKRQLEERTDDAKDEAINGLNMQRLFERESEKSAELKKLDAQAKRITAEAWMLENIMYIGNEIPKAVAADKRDKFVLLGYPQQMIDAVDGAQAEGEK